MNKSQIQIGKTYCNCGAGTTHRKVIDMGMHIQPKWYGGIYKRPYGEPGVRYEFIDRFGQTQTSELYLKSFASWAGKEVEIL
jgi:hypothetical protein